MKIVFFSTPATGHINAVYPVIEKLVKKGYIVDWYCSEKYKTLIEDIGANYKEYMEKFEQFNLNEITDNFYSLFGWLLDLNRKCYLAYLDVMEKENPDLIIYDSMCSFGKNIARNLKIKSVCFCTTLAFNQFNFLCSSMCFSTIKLFGSHLKGLLHLYLIEKKFRKTHGIKKLDMLDLFVNQGDITLVFTPKELQPFYKTFPKSFVFIGTTIKDRIHNNIKYENYDVYVSLGSIFTENKRFFHELLASEILKNKKTIITTGNIKMEEFSHVEFVEKTDQLSLLPKVDLFVNHAGLNSIYECLYFGKFQIWFPQQEEQRMVAIEFQKKKIGMHVENLKKITWNRLIEYKEKSEKSIRLYQNVIRSYDGTKLAVQNIEEMIKKEKI